MTKKPAFVDLLHLAGLLVWLCVWLVPSIAFYQRTGKIFGLVLGIAIGGIALPGIIATGIRYFCFRFRKPDHTSQSGS